MPDRCGNPLQPGDPVMYFPPGESDVTFFPATVLTEEEGNRYQIQRDPSVNPKDVRKAHFEEMLVIHAGMDATEVAREAERVFDVDDQEPLIVDGDDLVFFGDFDEWADDGEPGQEAP
jgi:hypothetical protein